MAIKLICSDFDGVLSNVERDYSKSGWYSSIANENPNLYNSIQEFLFRDTDVTHLIRSWMSGEITYKDINKIVANNFNINADYLDEKLPESAKKLELNWELIEMYQKYRKDGLKIVITSDNMDIFSLFTVPANNLNNYFDEIFNSADIKCLKGENELKLYKNIAKDNGLDLSEILIVDDGKKLIDNAEKIGFSNYLYNQNTCENFEKKLCEML